jgi:hypothetical protein
MDFPCFFSFDSVILFAMNGLLFLTLKRELYILIVKYYHYEIKIFSLSVMKFSLGELSSSGNILFLKFNFEGDYG